MWMLPVIGGVWLLWAAPVYADLYLWTDTEGTIHVVDDHDNVPQAYHQQIKVYREKRVSPAEASTVRAYPVRTYADQSQGVFAQRLALDLGLIRDQDEDAVGSLRNAGIQPTGGWRVTDPMTPEAYYEALAAARRAAESGRPALSADGAEAVVRASAKSVLPSLRIEQAAMPSEERDRVESVRDEGPDLVVIHEQPSPEVIEAAVPYYVTVVTGYPYTFYQRHDGRPTDRRFSDGTRHRTHDKSHRVSGSSDRGHGKRHYHYFKQQDGPPGKHPKVSDQNYRIPTTLLSSSPVGRTPPR